MKTENKSTQGPWHMDYHTSIFAQCPSVYTKNNELVANVLYGNTDDSAKEAAFLIAAAPDLLAALEQISDRLDKKANDNNPDALYCFSIARAAIAKAKGETNV